MATPASTLPIRVYLVLLGHDNLLFPKDSYQHQPINKNIRGMSVMPVPAALCRCMHLYKAEDNLKVLARALSDNPKAMLVHTFTRFGRLGR